MTLLSLCLRNWPILRRKLSAIPLQLDQDYFDANMRTKNTVNEQEVVSIFRSADAVCFDVDSTVVKEEGIDELASFCGVGQQVKAWTLKAMGGDITFRTALTERLKIINPSHQQIHEFCRYSPLQLTKGISEVVRLLHQRGTKVYLVSGGFHCFIDPVAEKLRIPKSHVFANKLKFGDEGEYLGFDHTKPTSEAGGKGRIIQYLKEKHGFRKVVMIGDGATDMEACPPADGFIGFGGNVTREKVKEMSPWFVTDFKVLSDEIQSN